jgi:endonuclease/exonuclease/phosphatase (EEP) superfamily protein YafD
MLRQDRQDATKGGVMIFASQDIRPSVMDITVKPLEVAMVSVSLQEMKELIIITVYRRPTMPTKKFVAAFQELLQRKEVLDKTIMILGDFNSEAGEDITQFFERSGFQQLISEPTTDYGSVIDHIYYNGTDEVKTEVVNTYYSDHDIITAMIKC